MLSREQLEKLWAYGKSLPKTQRMHRYVLWKCLHYQVGLLVKAEQEIYRLASTESQGLTDKERKYLINRYQELKEVREKLSNFNSRLQHSSAWPQYVRDPKLKETIERGNRRR